MNNMSKRFLFTFLVVGLCLHAIYAIDVVQILQSIPKDERLDFIRYHVRHGYAVKYGNTTEKTRRMYADEFSEAVYDFVTMDAIIKQQVSESDPCIICWPSGCLDLCDNGIHPMKAEIFSDICEC